MKGTSAILLSNIDKLHTTELGAIRIAKNLKLTAGTDPVKYCKQVIAEHDAEIFRRGKNWYVSYQRVMLTINAFNYCIITAHINNTF